MDLVVVTVSYNTRDLLADSLESVFAGLAQSGLASEVWVVDNASTDGSAEMVHERFPAVRLIAHSENLGFAAGNNLALSRLGLLPSPSGWPGPDRGAPASEPSGAKEGPRHVLFLNPDTRVTGDALGAMVRFLDATPMAGVVGARLVHGDGSFQHSAFAFPGLLQVFFDFFPLHHRLLDSRLNGRYPRRYYESGQAFVVDHPLGAALMIRADTLAQVGGFDERFFMYCEEIDLCRRIKAADWEIYCLPQAVIVHLEGRSTRQSRDRMFVALWRSRFLMFEKHESVAFRLVARWLVRVGLCAEAWRAERAFRRGEISVQEVDSRLAAYQRVAAL
jgi:N-acetylglucosaminyl-diphospho-decaprenol L-rhamnosyltransferase